MKNFGIKLIGVCALSTLMLPTSVLALEARDFADKLSATISALGAFNISFVDAQMDGNNVVLTGLDVTDVPGDLSDKVLETSVTFTNVLETAGGGYSADEAIFENLDIDKDGIHLIVNDITVSNIQLFADSATNIMNMMRLYSDINVGNTSVSVEDEEVFRIEAINVSTDWNDADGIVNSEYLVSGIYGDISKIDDGDAEEIFGMLKLSEINATMVGRSTWNIEEGTFSMPESAIDVDGIGRLNIGMELAGYTIAFVQKTQDMSRALSAADPTGENAELMGMQLLMSMAADLSLGELLIRFDDDSVTNNVMDFFGEKEGLSRKGMISTIAQVLPAMLAELEMPELQAEITDAVISFLTDPQSIQIKAAPAEPVPFMAMLAVAQNPSIAKSLLNLSVVANQPE